MLRTTGYVFYFPHLAWAHDPFPFACGPLLFLYLRELTSDGRLNQSFTDFVNAYRVEEAKRKLTDPRLRHCSVLAIAEEVGGQYTSLDTPDSSERIRTHTLLFGPRFSARRNRHVTPFAHALFGTAHNDSRARAAGFDLHFTDNSFALALGGGLDVRLGRRVAARAFQLDYLRTNLFGGSQHKGRLAFGLVLRLGDK